jgi:hypothetical protein
MLITESNGSRIISRLLSGRPRSTENANIRYQLTSVHAPSIIICTSIAAPTAAATAVVVVVGLRGANIQSSIVVPYVFHVLYVGGKIRVF